MYFSQSSQGTQSILVFILCLSVFYVQSRNNKKSIQPDSYAVRLIQYWRATRCVPVSPNVRQQMTGIKDLEESNYFPLVSGNLIAIGWLSPEMEFNKGKCEKVFFEQLKELCKNPFQPVVSAGLHFCELCQFEPPAFSSNLFLPHNGKIYVAPVAIVHYIAQHYYLPPAIFI